MTTATEPDTAADDPVYTLAAAKVIAEGKCSVSWVQREFSIGYARAARLVERMETMGIVSSANQAGKREVIDGATLRGAVEAARAPTAPREPTEIRNDIAKSARQGRAPMKQDPEFMAHNDKAFNVTADELRSFVERAEHVAVEIAEKRDDMKLVFAEAKARGYDTKQIRRLIALRKRNPEDVANEDAVFDVYKAALGIE